MSNAVRHRNITSVGHGVTALDQFPRVVLARTVFGLFSRMPPDSCGIEKNIRALHRRQPRRFRIPLVPANEHSYFCVARLPGPKAKITGREIEFLVEERVIRDMHLAI